MGVHGLWRLIEPSGKPVPVETLENKVLAVDVSIWLHQAIKGFQDAKGAPAVNAHLLGIFHRVCKLLYFKVKPIFVFDGGVPTLKRETIAKRNQLKHKNVSEADKIQKQLLDTLMKHAAINKVLADKAKDAISTSAAKTKEDEDIFKLPRAELNSTTTDDSDSETDSSPTKHWNLHNIDTKSKQFKSLPADVRHEILTDLKETRKQSSWGRLHELPTQSDDFSGFQMKRLLKRQEVQVALEEAEKEMGGHSLSLAELEEILKDEGVISKNVIGNRIASDENKRFVYIKNVKEALEKARIQASKKVDEEENSNEESDTEEKLNKADLELEEHLQKAIVLSLQDQPSSSKPKKLSEFSFLENFNDEDFDSEDDEPLTPIKSTKLSSAQNYMMEYSGLAPNEIARIIGENEGKTTRKRKIEEIPERIEVKKQKTLETIKEVEIMSDSDGSFEEVKELEGEQIIVENLKEKNGDKVIELSSNEEIPKINTSEEIPKKTEEPKVEERKSSETIEDVEIMSDSDGSLEEVKELEVKNMKEKHEDKVEKLNSKEEIPKINTSGEMNSDSDDFEEVPIKDEVLEIKFEADKIEEDDLFADIFTPKVEEIDEKKIEEKNETEKIEKITEEVEIRTEKPLKNVAESPKSKLLEDLIPKTDKKRDKITEDELKKMKEDLNKEQLELRSEQGLRERLGTNITDQMYKEAQDLLELFGLPYVIAPMEAEAQCAFLESKSLTDGTITDDSDIWLFGGKTVYKNFFNQSKHVLEYRAEDIKHHFKLSREQMILLALLVGSDYTVGLQGVGPVTALEILAAFPSSNTSTFTLSHNQLLLGLQEFKLWFENGKTFTKTKHTLRNKLKNIKFTDSFPSLQVVQAYLNPTVDTSEEEFSWSKPDLVALMDFGRKKFGWSKTKVEEILKPVIKKMKETKYQSTLLNYFQIKHNLNEEQARKLMSERVRTAVERIGKDPQEIEEIEESKKVKKVRRKKKEDGSQDSNTSKTRTLENEDVEVVASENVKKIRRKKKEGENIEVVQGSQDSNTSKKRALENEEDEDVESKKVKNIRRKKKGEDKSEKIEVVQEDDKKFEDECKKKTHKKDMKCVDGQESNALKKREVKSKKLKKTKEPEKNEAKISELLDESFVDSGKIEAFLESVEKEEAEKRNCKEKEVRTKMKKTIRTKKVQRKLSEENSIETQTKKSEEETASTTNKIFVEKLAKSVETQEPNTSKYFDKSENTTKKRKIMKPNIETKKLKDVDEELKLLKQTEYFSQKRTEEIQIEAEKAIEHEMKKETTIIRNLHQKEIIPQRERDKRNSVRTRLRAIEVFRKSKIDPSLKRGNVRKSVTPKEDAELSESSSDSL